MLPALAHSALNMMLSVAVSTSSARLAHVRMGHETEDFRDIRAGFGQDIPRPVSPTRRRDVFAATSIFADDSVVPSPWADRTAGDPSHTGGLMLPKGRSRYSPQQRGDAAQRDAERRARARSEFDQVLAVPMQAVPTQSVPLQATRAAEAPSMPLVGTRARAPDTSIELRARELVQEAIDAYLHPKL